MKLLNYQINSIHFLSDLEQDFIEFYKEYINDNEVNILKDELMQLNDKEKVLKRLSTYLNTISMRRKRANKTENATS